MTAPRWPILVAIQPIPPAHRKAVHSSSFWACLRSACVRRLRERGESLRLGCPIPCMPSTPLSSLRLRAAPIPDARLCVSALDAGLPLYAWPMCVESLNWIGVARLCLRRGWSATPSARELGLSSVLVTLAQFKRGATTKCLEAQKVSASLGSLRVIEGLNPPISAST